MNILIINGSPRKKGLISQMLGIMQAEAERRCHHHGSTLLLGQHPWADETIFRPHCIWYDARHTSFDFVFFRHDSTIFEQARMVLAAPSVPRAIDEGEKVHPSQHLHNALALEHLVQTITWCHPCHARNLQLFRLQDYRYHRTRRYRHASATV